jgi:hypothetical protein
MMHKLDGSTKDGEVVQWMGGNATYMYLAHRKE